MGLRPTVSQFAKPVEHHPEVRISLVLRALEAQDGVRRGYIHGNVAADGLRSSGDVCSAALPGEVPIQWRFLRQQFLQSLSEHTACVARCRF